MPTRPTNPPTNRPPARRLSHAALLALILAGSASAIGCQKALFAEDEPRSQYDRFDAIRDQRAQAYVEDEFGRRRPNVRGRLVQTE